MRSYERVPDDVVEKTGHGRCDRFAALATSFSERPGATSASSRRSHLTTHIEADLLIANEAPGRCGHGERERNPAEAKRYRASSTTR